MGNGDGMEKSRLKLVECKSCGNTLWTPAEQQLGLCDKCLRGYDNLKDEILDKVEEDS